MQLLRPKEAAKMLGVSLVTLRRMDKRGELQSIRTSGNQRRFHEDNVKELMGIREIRTVALYARVSSHSQKSDLNRQVAFLKLHYPDAEVFSDIHSGLKFNREGFLKLLKAIQSRQVSRVVVIHADRLARFGFDLVERVFAGYGTSIEVLESDEGATPQEELVKDLISIITSFSARLYGLRSHKTKKIVDTIRKELKQ